MEGPRSVVWHVVVRFVPCGVCIVTGRFEGNRGSGGLCVAWGSRWGRLGLFSGGKERGEVFRVCFSLGWRVRDLLLMRDKSKPPCFQGVGGAVGGRVAEGWEVDRGG